MFTNNPDKFDQHFLIDNEVIKKYIDFCEIKAFDVIVEVGPGKGTLTKLIAPKCKKMYAIELDKRLKEYLDNIDNLEVIYENVLDLELPLCNKIITSLPYSIIEPFMIKMIDTSFDELYMLMGSTYINNVLENNITRLSVITNSHFNITKLMDVLPNSFDIPPRTLSSIVKITKKDFNSMSLKNKIYNRLFYYRDKKIKNALMESLIDIKGITKKESKKIIDSLKIDNDILEEKFEVLSNSKLYILDNSLSSIY